MGAKVYRKKDFLNAFNDISEFLKPDELSDEIKKVKLEPPLNYADPHSIANEWAIYQWAKTIGCDKTDELTKVFQNVETNLYFKYLQTINPISEIDTILNEDLNIEPDEEFNNEHEDGPRVLLIDDEAEKGWYEIFAYLLGDLNEIYIDYLGDNFKNQSGEEIIDRSIQKIKDEDIDVVILDFRLNSNDFIGSNPKDISSIRLLEKIKDYNPGIQVIIFSATNKIWNLQTLQNAGADGFVFKGIHEWESNTTPVESMVNQINQSIKRVFLKELFQKISLIKKYIFQVDYVDDTDFEKFILGLITDIKIIEEACQQINLNRKSTLDIVFLSCYNLLEQFKSYYICYKDYSYVLGIDEIDMVRYSPAGKKIIDNGVFTPNNQYDKPSWFNSLASISIDYLQICNLNDGLIKKLAKIKNERNDFIHGKKTHFDQNELKMILNIIKVITKGVKE